MRLADFQGRRIAILGWGREGRAVRRVLAQRYPHQAVTIIDEAEFQDGDEYGLPADRRLSAPLGDISLGDYDILIKSPGISLYRNALQQAMAQGVHVTNGTNIWFAEHPDANTICVTGSKGKSTTAALCAHLLEACSQRVQLAGNIGLPLLDCMDRRADYWVIELSSYQTAQLQARPDIGILTNLFPEHLDWHGSLERYYQDKLRLLHQSRHKIINGGDSAIAERLQGSGEIIWFNHAQGFHLRGEMLYFGEQPWDLEFHFPLAGRHNLINLTAALSLLKHLSLDLNTALASLSEFHPLPHRLQSLGLHRGKHWIDDSISTTPQTAIAALQAHAGAACTILLGGYDRGLDWQAFADHAAAQPPHAVIALPDNGIKIYRLLRRRGLKLPGGIHLAANLEEAVSVADRLTPRHGNVILSPGAPSFPRFRNYEQRGRVFAASIKKLKDEDLA